MARNSFASRTDASHAAPRLAALAAAHVEVEPCLAALERLMEKDYLAASPEFSTTRHRLARANLGRAQVAREACGHLLSITPPAEAEALRDLHQREVDHFQLISQHIRRWSPQAVERDWDGYRAATRAVIDQVRQLLSLERKLIFPLLERAS